MKFQSVMQWFRILKTARDHAVRDDAGQAALVIITVVIIAAGVAISQTQLMNSRRGLEVTQAQRANFKLIKDAIEVSAIQDANFLLPCPSDPTIPGSLGTSVGNNGTICNLNRGIVPWTTLGLPRSSAIDPQGNYITYIVDNTNISVCNGENARVGTLNEAEDGTDYTFALISHGENGFGAYNSNSGNQTQVPTSAFELDNCPNPSGAGCDPGTNNEFRAGPFDETDGTSEFDDIVRAVQASETFTVECPVINEQDINEPPGAQVGFSRAETARVFTRSANNATQSSNSFDSTRYDADGDSENGSEKEVLRINSNDTFDTRACSYTEPTYPLQGYTIRQYAEVFFESTSAATRGSGLVLGYFAHKTDGGAPTDVTRANPGTGFNVQPPCGGTNQFLGFGDEQDALTSADSDTGDYTELAQPNDVFRFGLEIDTSPVFADTGEAEQIFDLDSNNHIAIILGNNNHAGDEGEVTNPPLDPVGPPVVAGGSADANFNGPVCRDDMDGLTITGDPGDSFGIDAVVNGGTRQVTAAIAADPDQPEACYQDASTTWLEDGDPIDQGSGFNSRFQKVRTELHWYDGNGCDDPATEVRFDAWVWNTGNATTPEACSTDPSDCDDLTSDYDDGSDAARRPHVSACIQIADVTAMEALRFGFTSGMPAAPTGADRGGEVTIQRFGLNFERTDTIVGSKTPASDTAQTRDFTEEDIRTDLGGAATGNLTLDQAFAAIPETTEIGEMDNARIFMERGKFHLDLDDFIGNQGVSDNNLISNIDVGQNPFQAETTFYPLDAREKLTVEFDNQYRRFTVNLRDFGATDNTGTDPYTGGLLEQVVLRAYNTNLAEDEQLVATETYRACDLNAVHNNNNSSMVISTDFGLTGAEYFDRVQIIPEPIDSSDIQGLSGFYVGAFKACGADVNCAFDRTLVTDNSNGDTEFRCVSFTPIAVASVGSGDTGEITADAVNTALGLDAGDPTDSEDTDRAWLDFNSYPDSGETLDLMISGVGEIQSTDTGNDENSGFGITNTVNNNVNFPSYGRNALLDMEQNPTGTEPVTETLIFHFEESWSRLRIGFSRFGQQLASNQNGNDGLDQAQVQLCDGGPEGTCETFGPITAGSGPTCTNTDGSNSMRGDAFLEPTNPSFDTVIVTPLLNTETTGNRRSDFYVRVLKACDAVGACTELTYGDNDGDGRWCDVTP
ncbi:MAG: hypothetical protein RIC29_18155 [Rhodospirillaceae bacterium]